MQCDFVFARPKLRVARTINEGRLYVSKQIIDLVTKRGKTFSYLAAMITYYFRNPEEALKRVKAAGKKPGCWWGGITLPSGKKGWAIYKGGKVVEQYAVM